MKRGAPLKRVPFKRKRADGPTERVSRADRPMAKATPSGVRSVMSKATTAVVSVPKSPRLVNKTLTDMARMQPCLLLSPICNRDPETTVACHGAGVALGKGMRYKLSDFWTVHGCSSCNHYTDAYNGATAEQKQAVFLAGHSRMRAKWEHIAATEPNTKEGRAARWALDHLKKHEGDTA